MKPPKTLPNDLQEILDNSVNGLVNGSVLMNFGTVITKDMYKQTSSKFLEAFPYKFLWKTDENIESIPTNVHIRKWFPQSDVLARPNLMLFITHGVNALILLR